jgi:signal peptidase II
MPAENRGVAFSLLRDHPGIIMCVSVGALFAILYLYSRIWRTAHSVMIVALGLLLIGAIGNLIDRLVFSYVRDFIQFVPPIPIIGHWAVFNVADMCITVGVILFVISELFLKGSHEKTEKSGKAQNIAV